jgi:hypothetical protein
MLGDQRLEFSHERCVTSGGEIEVDPLLQRDQPELSEPSDLGLGERLEGKVGERRAPPERECLAEISFRGEFLEALEIELAGLDAQLVAASVREDALATKALAKLRDVDLQGFLRRPWRPFAP